MGLKVDSSIYHLGATFTTMTLTIKGLFVTLSISNNQQYIYAECRYAECHDLFIVMLNVIILSVVVPKCRDVELD
jgi:hypothetical protein